jgi:hypothetical protein
MIEHRGVNYDVGTVMGGNWRPDYDPQTVQRELEIIKNDLHCNAVGISGKDIGRLVVTAEAALSRGLEAWLHPADWTNKPPQPTLAYIAEAARAAQPLHERYPGKVVFSVGSEFSLFVKGIVEPGKTFMQRMRTVFSGDYIESGKHNQPLNDYLARATAAVRPVFGGQVMYRCLVWEQVDWSMFDIIGVDHYWAEKIQDRYVDMVRPLFTYGKPVVNTGFGFNTTNAPVTGMASTLINTPPLSVLVHQLLPAVLHQLPVVGRFVRPKLKTVTERDEAMQAKRLVDNLKVLDEAGFSGAFMDTFIFPRSPYSATPKYDLDRGSSSLVKFFDSGRHGTTYPDMRWEPKESFKAVASYYAGV